jgi:hypothetical protein
MSTNMIGGIQFRHTRGNFPIATKRRTVIATTGIPGDGIKDDVKHGDTSDVWTVQHFATLNEATAHIIACIYLQESGVLTAYNALGQAYTHQVVMDIPEHKTSRVERDTEGLNYRAEVTFRLHCTAGT